jgi:hypothetical protein
VSHLESAVRVVPVDVDLVGVERPAHKGVEQPEDRRAVRVTLVLTELGTTRGWERGLSSVAFALVLTELRRGKKGGKGGACASFEG